MKERTYTEEEVAVLLERAADLQAQVARRAEHHVGLSLSELETIAVEAGLDPSLLRQAASEMDDPGKPSLRRNSGANATHIFVERWVQGTLTQEILGDVVFGLRSQFDSDMATSSIEQVGNTVEWQHRSVSGIVTRVLIRPRGEGLHVRLSQRVGLGSTTTESLAYGLVVASLVAMITFGAAESVGIGLSALLVSLLMAVPLIFYADRTWRQKKHEALEVLADDVEALLAASEETPEAIAAPEQSATPQLDVSLLERDLESEPDGAQAQQVSSRNV